MGEGGGQALNSELGWGRTSWTPGKRRSRQAVPVPPRVPAAIFLSGGNAGRRRPCPTAQARARAKRSAGPAKSPSYRRSCPAWPPS
ncbi:Protein Lifeguard 2 [Manis pentadactyla]|nr:Protein Lifeguard 2 [Manis pentadactyla]